MPATLNVNEIYSQVRQLDKEQQLTLLERLVLLIRKKEQKSDAVTLSSISGLGADLWKGVDIDKFIDEERQW
jgi:hypothetical protein